MKRPVLALLVLLVIFACGVAAWFVTGGLDEAIDRPAPVVLPVDPAETDVEDAPDETDPARVRRHTEPDGTEPVATTAMTLRGRVLYRHDPVAGAEVAVYAVPEGSRGLSDRELRVREIFGDAFEQDELRALADQMGGGMMGGRMGGGSSPAIAEDEVITGVTVSVEVEDPAGTSGESEVSTTIDPASIDLGSDEMQDAMSTGMEAGMRLFAQEELLDKALAIGRLEMAGFESDPQWERIATTRTDADGNFVIEGLDPHEVDLRVTASGYVRSKQRVAPSHDELTLQLRRGAVLAGSVVSEGQAVAGAQVRTKTTTLETDGAGSFRLDGAVPPRESLIVSARGYIATGLYVDLDADTASDPVVIELAPAAIVSGVVLDREGAPVAGALVSVASSGFNPMMFMGLANQETLEAPTPTALTDANGRFELDGLAGGSLSLRAEKPGFLAEKVSDLVATVGSELTDVEITLTKESVLTGLIVSTDGQPIALATVKVEAPPAEGMGAMIAGMMGGSWITGRTDTDGRYRIGKLRDGERKVRIEAPGHLHAETTLALPLENELVHDAKVEPGHNLTGIVLSPDGDPLVDARVEVTWASGAPANPMAAMMGGGGRPDARGKTDADGRFSLIGLQAGPYTVTAKMAGYLDATLDDVPQGSPEITVTLGAAATLRGHVIDENSGERISGAWVIRKGGKRAGGAPWMAMLRQDPRVLTDDQGAFEITGLDPGKYTLSAERKGWAKSADVAVECESGAVTEGVELVLRTGEILNGRVIERGTAAPVEGAVVYVSTAEGPLAGMNMADITGGPPSAPAGSISAKTDPGGAFQLQGLTPGTVTIHVRSEHHAAGTLGNIAVPGTDVTIEVGAGGTVEGVVLDSDGNARTGITVMLTAGAMGFGGARQTTSGSDGSYRLGKVVPGSYQLMMMGGENAFGMEGMTPVVVRDGEVTTHDFRPAVGTPVSGLVMRDGKPLSDAVVILTGGTVGMKMSTSDAKGGFRFEGLAPGEYTVMVQSNLMGGGTNSQKVVVGETGVVADLRIELSSLVVEGRVLDAVTGDGVPMAQVILLESGSGGFTSLDDIVSNQRGQAITDDRGRFKMSGVSAGSFALRVTASGYAQKVVEGVSPGGAPFDVRVDPGSEVVVTVLGPNGKPVANATVVSEDASGNETLPFGMGFDSGTNAEGQVTLKLGPGRYTLHAESAEYPAGSAQVDSQAGSVTIRLTSGGSIDVTVTRNGEAVPGVRVTLLDADGSPLTKRVSMSNLTGSLSATDTAGRLVRDGLPGGRVTVAVQTPGGAEVRRETTVTPGRTARVTVELE